MAEGKNKIVVYRDWITTFESLNDDEAGRLIKHFFRYVNDQNPEPPDRLTGLIFEPIKQTLKRDLANYLKSCDKNRENINIRWNKNNTDVYERIPADTKHTDSDNDSDNDKKYIYNAFYDSEIEKAKDEQYTAFVKFLFGENDLGRPMKKLLKMQDQIGIVQFLKLREVSEQTGRKIYETCRDLENYTKKSYSSLYLTLNKWLKNVRRDN